MRKKEDLMRMGKGRSEEKDEKREGWDKEGNDWDKEKKN